jgi:hypothetical protein
LTPNIPAKHYADDPQAIAIAIAKAAARLDELRNVWLNAPDLVRIEPEVVPGYPDRILLHKCHFVRTGYNLNALSPVAYAAYCNA